MMGAKVFGIKFRTGELVFSRIINTYFKIDIDIFQEKVVIQTGFEPGPFQMPNMHASFLLSWSRLFIPSTPHYGHCAHLNYSLWSRFKDKTPTPLTNLDSLLEGTYRQVQQNIEAVEQAVLEVKRSSNSLSCITNLLVCLVR